jgi:hypothetical protein
LVLVVRLAVQEQAQGLELEVIQFLVAIPQTVEAAVLDILLRQAQHYMHLKLVVLAAEVLVEVILEPLVILHLQALHKVIVVVTERALAM